MVTKMDWIESLRKLPTYKAARCRLPRKILGALDLPTRAVVNGMDHRVHVYKACFGIETLHKMLGKISISHFISSKVKRTKESFTGENQVEYHHHFTRIVEPVSRVSNY